MHKVSNYVAPVILNEMFKKLPHKYFTNFSHGSFSLTNIIWALRESKRNEMERSFRYTWEAD